MSRPLFDFSADQLRLLAKWLPVIAKRIPIVGDAIAIILEYVSDELRDEARDIDRSEAIGKAQGEAVKRTQGSWHK